MAMLEYSVGAKNIRHRFFQKDIVLYVEGVEDIEFWRIVFEKASSLKVRIEERGGKTQIRSLIDPIIDGEASYLVAIDSDFDFFVGGINHSNILKTFGYSMENTLISDESLGKAFKLLVGNSGLPFESKKFSDWVAHIEVEFRSLLDLDIYNRVEKLGFRTIPEICDRFMEGSSEFLSPEKIKAFESKIGFNVDPTSKLKFGQIMSSNGLKVIDLIRGHFLVSLCRRFLMRRMKQVKKSLTLSGDDFQNFLVAAFELTFGQKHPHFGYYQQKLAVLENRRSNALRTSG